jgi:hypothetical protein
MPRERPLANARTDQAKKWPEIVGFPAKSTGRLHVWET